MIKVNVYVVKARLSEYLERASRGERIVICRHNKPVAELRPIEEARLEPRPIGPLPGRPTFDIPPAFFDPMPENEFALWEGMTPSDPLARSASTSRGRPSKVAEARTQYGHRPVRRKP